MVLFELVGREKVEVILNGKHIVEYAPTTFKCAYDKKTKKCYFLRAGGVYGAEVRTLPDAIMASIVKSK